MVGVEGAGPLRVERTDDGVVTLTLALPERRNAMTPELTQAWGEAVAALAADASVRSVVVTGEGSAFCSGGDLSWIADGAEALSPAGIRARMLPFYRTWLSVRDLEVPVLAAVNGPAIGAGLCLALACDLRWATPTARLAAPFTSLGMHPGMAATYLLTEAVGVVRAREMLYVGDAVSGPQAVEWGLVSGLREPEALLPAVQEVAARIAGTAPVATRLLKAGLAQGSGRGFEESLRYEALAQPVTMAMDDLAEGMAAAREKRPPRFTGR